MAARLPTLLVAVVLGGALALSACSRCGVVRDRFDATVRDELARAGAGVAPDTGLHDHARLVISPSAIAVLVRPLLRGDWLRPAVEQRLVGDRRDRALEVEVLPRVTAVRTTPAPSGVVARVELELVAHARVDAVGERQRYTTATTSSLDATLRLEQGENPRLVLDASDVLIGDAEFGFDGLDESLRGDAQRMARSLLEELVRDAPNALPLVRWSPIEVAGRAMPLTASSLTATEDGALHVGFVTPLRPRGPLLPVTSGPASGVQWIVHADLPRAALEHLVVAGGLPRRFDADGRVDVVGAWAASSSAVRLGDEDASHAFRWWCLEGRRCGVWRGQVVFDIELVDGAPRLGAGEVTSTTAGAPSGGRYRGWTEAVRRAIEGAITPPPMRASTRERIDVALQGWTLTSTAVRFAGELRDDPL